MIPGRDGVVVLISATISSLSTSTRRVRSFDVQTPSRKMLVGEFFNSHEHEAGSPIGYWGTLTTSGVPGADRGTGARNYAFADGHAAFIFASRQTRTPLDECPDMLRTPGGVSGSDLR